MEFRRRYCPRADHRESSSMRRFSFVLLGFLALPAGEAGALDQVRFGTNWVAEAEHAAFTRPSPTALTKNMALMSSSCRAGRTRTTGYWLRSVASTFI